MIDLERARTRIFQANYHLIWATKYRRKVLAGSVEVKLEEVLKTIAQNHGFVLLAARVHDGDHLHLFVSAKPKVCIPEMVRVFKCVCRNCSSKRVLKLRGGCGEEAYGLKATP